MFKKSALFLSFSIFLIYSLFACAATSEDPEFQSQYRTAMTNAQSAQSFLVNFFEEFYSILRDKVTQSSGTLAIQKPASFRFEIISPRSELYVTNGTDFWKYVADLQHAQYLSADSVELSFLKVLTDLKHLKKLYQVSPWTNVESLKLNQDSSALPLVQSDAPPSPQKGFLYVKLIPRGEDKQQKVLYAIIQVKTGLIQELRIVELNGDRTRLVFKDYSLKSLTPDLFNFHPPEGIVVDGLD